MVRGRAETDGCGFQGRMSRSSPSWQLSCGFPGRSSFQLRRMPSPWARFPQMHPRGTGGRVRPVPAAAPAPRGLRALGALRGTSPGPARGAQSGARGGESPSRGHGPRTSVRISGSRRSQAAVVRAPARRGGPVRLPAFPGCTCACVAFSPRSPSTAGVPGRIPGAGALEVNETKAEDILSGPANGRRMRGPSPWFWRRGRR